MKKPTPDNPAEALFYAADGGCDEAQQAPACCPLCGADNQCLMARPGYHNPRDCWCMTLDERLPEELLELVPAEQRGQRCICQACVQAYWRGEIP